MDYKILQYGKKKLNKFVNQINIKKEQTNRWSLGRFTDHYN